MNNEDDILQNRNRMKTAAMH